MHVMISAHSSAYLFYWFLPRYCFQYSYASASALYLTSIFHRSIFPNLLRGRILAQIVVDI